VNVRDAIRHPFFVIDHVFWGVALFLFFVFPDAWWALNPMREGPIEHLGHFALALAIYATFRVWRQQEPGAPRWFAGFMFAATVFYMLEEFDYGQILGLPSIMNVLIGKKAVHTVTTYDVSRFFEIPVIVYFLLPRLVSFPKVDHLLPNKLESAFFVMVVLELMAFEIAGTRPRSPQQGMIYLLTFFVFWRNLQEKPSIE